MILIKFPTFSHATKDVQQWMGMTHFIVRGHSLSISNDTWQRFTLQIYVLYLRPSGSFIVRRNRVIWIPTVLYSIPLIFRPTFSFFTYFPWICEHNTKHTGAWTKWLILQTKFSNACFGKKSSAVWFKFEENMSQTEVLMENFQHWFKLWHATK